MDKVKSKSINLEPLSSMSNEEDTTKATRSIFHFLHIDSNEENWYRIHNEFNPPYPAERSTIEGYWEKIRIHPNYDLLFTYSSSFENAIYSMVNHNIDDAYPEMVHEYPFNSPFNGILFEVKIGRTPEKYRWNHFLEDLSRIGLKRLKLNDGFIAFGSRFNDTTKEILMRYNTRKLLSKTTKEIFSMEQLKTDLVDYFNVIDGSSFFQVERIINRNDKNLVEYVDRVVQFEDNGTERRTLHLPRIIVNEEMRFSYLVPPPANDDFSRFEKVDE